MAKKGRGVENIDDLIEYAKKAGLDYIVEKAEDIKRFHDHLKELNVDKLMTFQEFLDLKEGEKYIFVCYEEDEYSFSDIEEKEGNVVYDSVNNTIQFSTSSGDPNVEVSSLNDNFNMAYHEGNSDYQYSVYSILTRKKKIKKVLEDGK